MSKVYLVGAGPGDPELITWKGRNALALADCVFYDRLASPALLALAPPAAERVYVGKHRSHHPIRQDEIARMLIERARRGQNVVRLKGGDPFIFGRGGEEVEALADAGIPFEVIPGVTAPLGIAAYTGVPLTHREHTSAVTFVTGHNVASVDWPMVAHSETLVIFMGLHYAPDILDRVRAAGRSPGTPAMAVSWGTRPDQITVVGTLGTLPALLSGAGLHPPVTIIIGEVVRLRDKLNWFERRPLFGRRVVVTRAAAQAGDLAALLRDAGAMVEEVPTIELRALPPHPALEECLTRLADYDWVLFTSVNAVEFFLHHLDRSPQDLRGLNAKIAVIGPATRAAVEALHLKVSLMPERFIAEGLAEAFAAVPLSGARVLIPRAAVAREVAPDALRARGAHVDAVEIYENVLPETAAERAAEVFQAEIRPHWALFTSPSTFQNLLEVLPPSALEGVAIASIGRVTSQAIQSRGFAVAAEADPSTMAALVDAVIQAESKRAR